MSVSVSLDGYIEGPNREIDWHLVDEELHTHLNEQLGSMSGFLSGRVTHELMAAYWPTADGTSSSASDRGAEFWPENLDKPAASAEPVQEFWPEGGAVRRGPTVSKPVAEFARIWRDMPKVVYSKTLQHADWNTTIVRDVVVEEVLALKAKPGSDLALSGADLIAEFRRHDLVDGYHVYVHPVLIGSGKPLFSPTDDRTNLRHLDTRTFGNGVVLLRYERDSAS
ncbi:RibD domain-containing protein [Umezawaea tangerina]|uniref:RibD domain-containing protein n=1 Tax=Umezawaea tangerina TaxID=84725 RepID=A0A2T0TKZ5_9PSEU|nr:RibD domain-containing protein [Umezawaea tangerina]